MFMPLTTCRDITYINGSCQEFFTTHCCKGNGMEYEQRYTQAIYNLFDLGFGTLWQVREDFWKENLSDYDQNSERTWHPAVSIRRQSYPSREKMPVLFGTSIRRKRAQITVKGLTAHRGPEHATYFGNKRAFVSFRELGGTDPLASVNREHPVVKNGLWVKRVLPNKNKRRCERHELTILDAHVRKNFPYSSNTRSENG